MVPGGQEKLAAFELKLVLYKVLQDMGSCLSSCWQPLKTRVECRLF